MQICLLELSIKDGGPFVDLLSFSLDKEEDIFYSLLCIRLCAIGIYLEFFGIILIDTFPDDDEGKDKKKKRNKNYEKVFGWFR